MTFLRRILKAGPVAANEVRSRWEAAGLKEKTVRRAKEELDIKSVFSGKQWAWTLQKGPVEVAA
jgi:hypothetical protein